MADRHVAALSRAIRPAAVPRKTRCRDVRGRASHEGALGA